MNGKGGAVDALLINIAVPLLVSVASGLMVHFLVKGRTERRDVRLAVVLMLAVLVFVVVLILTLQIAPYRVESVAWCEQADGSVQVSGRLVTLVLGQPVSGSTVQIKLFPEGAAEPVAGPEYADTTVAGEFAVLFSPITLDPDKTYLINTAYSYYPPLVGEKWSVADFRKAEPSPC